MIKKIKLSLLANYYLRIQLGVISVFLFLTILLPYSVKAEVVPIPLGCPGSTQQGPPTAQNLAVCATIPLGCPGSTQQGPVSPNFDRSTCPYGVDINNEDPPAECSGQILDENKKCKVKQDCNTSDGSPITSDNCGIVKLLIRFINILSALVGIAVVIVIIIAGIQYSASAGDPQAAAAAKKRIFNAVLALVLFGLVYGFLQWIVPGGIF